MAAAAQPYTDQQLDRLTILHRIEDEGRAAPYGYEWVDGTVPDPFGHFLSADQDVEPSRYALAAE